MTMTIVRTLSHGISRVQTLHAFNQKLEAMDRCFEELGDEIGAENVVIIRETPTFEDHLLEVLRAVRPDIKAIETMVAHGRKAILLFLSWDTVAVDVTDCDQGKIVRKIMKEVLAA